MEPSKTAEIKKLAEIMSSAGLSSGRVATEVLYLLPTDFVREYVRLWDRALSSNLAGGGGRTEGSDQGQGPGRSAKGGEVRSRPTKMFKGVWVIKDEAALREKGRVDKKLRKIARDLRGAKKGREQRRCAGCKRWLDDEWNYCAGCGERT